MSLLPDPLEFSARTLERMGALVDVAGARASVVLPWDVAARLGLAEDLDVGDRVDGAVDCGAGSPLLEALIEEGRRATVLAAASSSLLPARESAVRAVAEQFVVRNGVAAVAGAEVVTRWYLVVALAWSVESDERSEGLVVAAIDPSTGARPRVDLHLDPDLVRQDAVAPPPLDPASVSAWVARLARAVVEPAVAAPLASVARRHAGEHDRVKDYYRQLVVEARHPRRRVDRAAIAAKVDHLVRERDARLAELGRRYEARVTMAPASALWLSAQVGVATLRARRRKGERELRLTLAPGAKTFDRLPCDGCDAWVDGGVALCDERLHVLCAGCVPEATGRPRCPACEPAPGSGT